MFTYVSGHSIVEGSAHQDVKIFEQSRFVVELGAAIPATQHYWRAASDGC